MNALFPIIGSIASIGAIPLAIYLYLRSREAKYARLRHEIVKILSYQIGEGRNLSIFEVQSVIDHKLRDHRAKQNSITVNEIVEEIVAETISSPMLDGQRKEQILKNLQQIHPRGNILLAIDKYGISYRDFIHSIKDLVKLSPEYSKIISKEIAEEAAVEAKVPKRTEAVSAIFAFVVAITTLIAFLISIIGKEQIIDNIFGFLKGRSYQFELLLGISASLVGGTLTGLIVGLRNVIKVKKSKKGKE